MTKYPKHESKMGYEETENMNTVPSWPHPSFRSELLEAIFWPGFSELRESLFLWSTSEVGVKIPFLSEGSPVMKRAFHSPWVGPEQRAATLWKEWAKLPLPLQLAGKAVP